MTEPEQTFSSRGSEAPLMEQCLALVREAWGLPHLPIKDDELPEAARRDINLGSGDTGNHRGLKAVAEYGRAMRSKVPQRMQAARNTLARFFELQRTTHGHQYREFLAVTHRQIWLHLVACAFALARHYGDDKMLHEVLRWIARDLWIGDRMVRQGHWFGVGTRTESPVLDVNDVWYSLLTGKLAPANSFARPGRPLMGPAFWQQSYNACCWIMNDSRLSLDPHVFDREEPVLAFPVHILTNDRGDWLHYVPMATGDKPILWWWANVDGEHQSAPVDMRPARNRPCPTSPPCIRDAKLEIIPGVG